MAAIVYPATLPCPQTASLQRPERRALPSLPGLLNSRPLWRDKAGTTQPVTFVLITAAMVQEWLNWGNVSLYEWAAWFAADWPQPEGGVGVRRFVGVPSYPEWLPSIQGWRVQAMVELRGRTEMPADPALPHVCTEGPTWSATVVPNRAWSLGATYGTRFVAMAFPVSGAVPGDVIWSDDGVTWILSSPGPGFGNGFSGSAVAYNPTTESYFMIGNQSNKRFVSADGKVWADATGQPNVGNQVRFAVWEANGEFLFATNTPSRVYSTPDGNSPVAHATPEQFSTGCYANSKYYGVCSATRNVYTSVDKIAWSLLAVTTNSAADGTLKIIAGAANQLVAISTAQQNKVSYSSDGGATWNDSTGLPVPASFYQDGIYAQGVFLIVDADGYCYTSPDGGATFTLSASSLRAIGGADDITWSVAHDGDGLYVGIQSLPGGVPTATAAVGHCFG